VTNTKLRAQNRARARDWNPDRDWGSQTFGELRDNGVRVSIHCTQYRHRSFLDVEDADVAERTAGAARFICADCGQPGRVVLATSRRIRAR
jgi:hypothetical protein